MSESAEEQIARLTRERDEMATQASACAEEVDRVRVEIGAAQAENERLRERLREEEARADRFARHMRENGDLVAEIGGELALAGCRIAALTGELGHARTALAESERKRVEEISTEREACAAICDERAKYFDQATAYREWTDAARSYRATAKDIRKRATVRAALATPTQETSHVEI